jgi:hypothetical protein
MSAYRPPMSTSAQSAARASSTASTAPRTGESRTWTARPRDSTESNSASTGGRQFDRPTQSDRYSQGNRSSNYSDRSSGGYRNDRGSGNYRNDRGSGGYRNDRPSGSYRDNRSIEDPRSPKPLSPPKINSNDFPSLAPQPAVERPKIPWAEMATKKATEPTVVEQKAPESGWSNVVVKMATQVSQEEAQLAEEKRIRLEKHQQQAEANKASSKNQMIFHVPFSSGTNPRSQYDDEDDDYIPPPAYGHQTPLDDDDYDYDESY